MSALPRSSCSPPQTSRRLDGRHAAGRWQVAACAAVLGAAVWLAPGARAADEVAPVRLRAEPPFFWAFGVGDPSHLDRYTALGLNLLWVDVQGNSDATDARALALISAAEKRGLPVIVGLPTAMGWLKNQPDCAVSPHNEAYVRALRDWVPKAVKTYGQSPAVVGWGTQHWPEWAIAYSDDGFRSYLAHTYDSAAALNRVWGSKFSSLSALRMADAAGHADDPFGVNRASLDLAEYQRQAFSGLLGLWAQTLREADPDGMLFTGRLRLFRSLLSVPEQYDCVVADPPIMPDSRGVPPEMLQGVVIGRRGGQRRSVITVSPPPASLSGAGHGAQRAATLSLWITAAGVRGASGAAFTDWLSVRGDTALWQPLHGLLTASPTRKRFRTPPVASAAIVLSPYARGESVGTQALYGYLTDQAAGEPGTLLRAFVGGTRYGQLDVFAADDLTQVKLEGYSCLLMPQPYRLPDEAQAALDEYVLQGGVVVADWGAGTYESGSWLELSPRLASIFGVAKILRVSNAFSNRTSAANARISAGFPEFPSLAPGAKTTGLAQGLNEQAAFAGWHSTVTLSDAGRALAIIDTAYDERFGLGLSGLVARRRGLGLGIYATVRLWDAWSPECPVFRAFHNDLLRRRARVQLLEAQELVPAAGAVGQCGETVWVHNLSGEQRVLKVLVLNAGNRAYFGAVAEASALRPTPEGTRSGAEVLTMNPAAGELAEATPLPLTIEPLADTTIVLPIAYSPKLVEFEAAGKGATVRQDANGLLKLRGVGKTEASVTLDSGTYPVAPGSRHQVTIRHVQGLEQERQEVLSADAQGRLRFVARLWHHTVTIKPAS